MKLYKEMLRKLAIVGLPLMAVVLVYTLIRGGADCFGKYYILQSSSAVSQIPALRYYVFSSLLFALYGFSFQFSRSGSDVYHSLPVKRTEMYTAVLLATATWMGATILLSEIEMLLIYLISGCPFVPVYIPLSALYYFVASMLVYAAAALGCALSGTIITAAASTGIILFLPRLMQFMFARGVVERVPIIGWLDLGPWLDPSTNAATGILTMMVRNVFNGRLITLPHALYSLLPTVVMLGAGLWLFRRRPSEFAHRNGGYPVWTIATGVMLAFAVMLPITMNYQRLLSVYGAFLMTAALGVYVLYQLLASSKLKKVMLTLPYFLLAVFAVLGFNAVMNSSAEQMLNTTPSASEIASVEFPGYDRSTSEPTYATLLTRNIAFTDEKTKAYVADALAEAVAKLQPDNRYGYYEYSEFGAVEPVIIHLAGGGIIRRTIQFDDIDDLNKLRIKNSDFDQAIATFPPLNSIQYLWMMPDFTPEESQAILESFIAESDENDLLSNSYYRSRRMDILPTGHYLVRDDQQTISSIYLAGYVGSRRYNDSYTIRLNTPKTASLLMRTHNSYAKGDSITQLQDIIKTFDENGISFDENLSLSMSMYNYMGTEGYATQYNVNFYANQYTMRSEYEYDAVQLEYMRQFAQALTNTELTDEPVGLFLSLNWNYRKADGIEEESEYDNPDVFLRFTDEASEQAFIKLLDEWNALQQSF